MVETRRFRLRDLPQVLRIERAAFAADGYHGGTFLAHAFRDRRGFFVAAEDRAIIGYVLARVGLHWLGPRRGGLTSLAVAPAHRRRGVGRLLVLTALDYLRARRAEIADLEVNVANRAAQSLYGSLGFRCSRRLPHYYGSDRDGLQMVLSLVPPSEDRGPSSSCQVGPRQA
jgi:ribosomal-protein-alanine N-acetyltransferase